MRTDTIRDRSLVVGAVAAILTLFAAALAIVVQTAPSSPNTNQGPPALLLQPVVALVVLTAVVCLTMVVYRNIAFILGTASLRYFKTFLDDKPAEWIERPTRTYMNLLELPVLFYLVCLLMLITGKFDAAQVSLAWVFVITRYMHAFIYIGFNYVPLRFAAFMAGIFTLAVMWARFAAQNLS